MCCALDRTRHAQYKMNNELPCIHYKLLIIANYYAYIISLLTSRPHAGRAEGLPGEHLASCGISLLPRQGCSEGGLSCP